MRDKKGVGLGFVHVIGIYSALGRIGSFLGRICLSSYLTSINGFDTIEQELRTYIRSDAAMCWRLILAETTEVHRNCCT